MPQLLLEILSEEIPARMQAKAEADLVKALMDGLYDAYDAGTAKSADDLLAVAQAALARGSGDAGDSGARFQITIPRSN